MKKLFITLLAMVVALALFASGQAAFADHPGGGGYKLSTSLTGAEEVRIVPGQPPVFGVGDPDGSGTADLRLNQGQEEICFTIKVMGIAPGTRAHIHQAPAGSNGGIVVPFVEPSGTPTFEDNVASGCVEASAELIKEIRHNPENYYVNVHNSAFPAGALRGQLGD